MSVGKGCRRIPNSFLAFRSAYATEGTRISLRGEVRMVGGGIRVDRLELTVNPKVSLVPVRIDIHPHSFSAQ